MISPGGPIGEADLESFRKPESIESLETDGMTHTIVSGDTLGKIARDNNTTIADIMAANPQIKDANKIGIGDQINLEGAAPVAAAGTDRSSVIEQATPPRKSKRKVEEQVEETSEHFGMQTIAFTSFAESLVKGLANRFLGADFAKVKNTAVTVGPGGVAALNGMYEYVKSKGRTKFDKDEWAKILDVDLARTDGKGIDTSSIITKVLNNPAASMAMTIGAGEFKTDKDGRVYVEDVYDFNEGKKGLAFKKKVTKLGLFPAMGELFSRDDLRLYDKVRILGFVVQPTRDNGKTRIFLDGRSENLAKEDIGPMGALA